MSEKDERRVPSVLTDDETAEAASAAQPTHYHPDKHADDPHEPHTETGAMPDSPRHAPLDSTRAGADLMRVRFARSRRRSLRASRPGR